MVSHRICMVLEINRDFQWFIMCAELISNLILCRQTFLAVCLHKWNLCLLELGCWNISPTLAVVFDVNQNLAQIVFFLVRCKQPAAVVCGPVVVLRTCSSCRSYRIWGIVYCHNSSSRLTEHSKCGLVWNNSHKNAFFTSLWVGWRFVSHRWGVLIRSYLKSLLTTILQSSKILFSAHLITTWPWNKFGPPAPCVLSPTGPSQIDLLIPVIYPEQLWSVPQATIPLWFNISNLKKRGKNVRLIWLTAAVEPRRLWLLPPRVSSLLLSGRRKDEWGDMFVWWKGFVLCSRSNRLWQVMFISLKPVVTADMLDYSVCVFLCISLAVCLSHLALEWRARRCSCSVVPYGIHLFLTECCFPVRCDGFQRRGVLWHPLLLQTTSLKTKKF